MADREFGNAAQRAAAQTMLALATLHEPTAAGTVVTIADAPADQRGRIAVAGQRVDAADAIVAGATLLEAIVQIVGDVAGEEFLRSLGLFIAHAETTEAA